MSVSQLPVAVLLAELTVVPSANSRDGVIRSAGALGCS